MRFASQASSHSATPSAVCVSGFSTMTWAPRSSAIRPSARCESGGVQTTTPSTRSSAASSVSVTVANGNCVTAAARASAAMSHADSDSTPTVRKLPRWRRPMEPRPMIASFTLLLSGRRSRTSDGGWTAEARVPRLLLFGQGIDRMQSVPLRFVAGDAVEVTEDHELTESVKLDRVEFLRDHRRDARGVADVEQKRLEVAVVLLEDARLVFLIPLRARIRRREERLHLEAQAIPGQDVVAQAVEVLVGKSHHLVRDRADPRLERPPQRPLVGLGRGAFADRLHHPRRKALVAVHEVRAAGLLDRSEHFGAAQRGVAGPAPMHAVAALGIVLDTVADALRLEAFLDPQPRDVGEPRLARELVHRHEVLVEEADEIDAEAAARVFDEIHDVPRTVIPDHALVAEGHVRLAVSLDVLHVAGDAEMEAEATDQRAAVARVDVQAPAREHALLGEERHAVLEVHLERKQIPRRIGKRDDVVEQRLLGREVREGARVAPDEAANGGPVAIARIQPAQELGERHERLADHADVDLRQEPHDVVRHARQKAAAGDDESLRRHTLRHPDDVLDGPVRRRDAAERDDVPAIGLEDLRQHGVGGTPGVGVVDLDEIARKSTRLNSSHL